MTDHNVILCLGSNTSDASVRIARAIESLSRQLTVVKTSRAYINDDDTGRGAPYLNMVARCSTTMPLERLTDILAELEAEGGRTSASKAAAVMPLDIDIVVWDDRVVSPHDFSRPYFTTGYRQL